MGEPLSQDDDSVFRQIVEGAPDGVVVLRWPTIVFINEAAAYCLGFRRTEDVLSRSILEFLSPDEATVAQERAGHVLLAGQRLPPAQYTGRDPDGVPMTVEVSAKPVHYNGAPAVVAFVRDVTERARLQERVRLADRLTAGATLAAGVAHEINNPLGYLLLNLEAMLRDLPKLREEQATVEVMRRRLSHCMQGGQRVKTIVRDLQAFTYSRAGRPSAVDLAAVVRSVGAMVTHELPTGAMLKQDIALVPNVAGERTRLEQLVHNLLLNAIHAVRDAAPKSTGVHLSLAQDGEQRVLLSIRDDGVGMDEETKRKIFEPFFTTKPLGHGTGLGLAVCDTIVRASGGTIEVDSKPGQGTTVHVRLSVFRDSDAVPSGT